MRLHSCLLDGVTVPSPAFSLLLLTDAVGPKAFSGSARDPAKSDTSRVRGKIVIKTIFTRSQK